MNIACISCPARYGVPDEKLAGKRVRITCKRCGTVLLVDGTVSPPRVSSGAGAGPSVVPVARASLSPAPAARAATPAPAPHSEYLVTFADDRQENADTAQIVRLYRDRRIDGDALVWREGMAEWAKVWDVEEIAAAFRRMGYSRPSRPTPAATGYAEDPSEDVSTHVAPSSRPQAALFDEDEATSVVDSSRLAAEAEQALRQPSAGWQSVSEDDEDPTNVVPSPMERSIAASPVAASPVRTSTARSRSERPQRAQQRGVEPAPAREEPRARAQTRDDSRARQQGLDLFAQRAQAEQELAPAVDDDSNVARLTGARGENSVLFSLDALIQQEQQAKKPLVLPARARTDESVLVDSSPSLASGGGMGMALAAPDFTAPVSAPPPRITAAATAYDDIPAAGRSRRWPVVALLALGGIGGLGGWAWMTGRLQPLLGIALPVAVPTESARAEPRSAPERESATVTPSAAAEAAPSSTGSSAAASASTAPSGPPGTAVAARAPTPREPGTARPGEAPAPREAEKPAPAPAAAGGAFDTTAAKASLTSAANNAASCREAAGPTGSGKVSITFAPSGRPMSVAVTGDLAGTTVGSCVARLFRATRVPAFAGDPVTVSKAFSVQ